MPCACYLLQCSCGQRLKRLIAMAASDVHTNWGRCTGHLVIMRQTRDACNVPITVCQHTTTAPGWSWSAPPRGAAYLRCVPTQMTVNVNQLIKRIPHGYKYEDLCLPPCLSFPPLEARALIPGGLGFHFPFPGRFVVCLFVLFETVREMPRSMVTMDSLKCSGYSSSSRCSTCLLPSWSIDDSLGVWCETEVDLGRPQSQVNLNLGTKLATCIIKIIPNEHSDAFMFSWCCSSALDPAEHTPRVYLHQQPHTEGKQTNKHALVCGLPRHLPPLLQPLLHPHSTLDR